MTLEPESPSSSPSTNGRSAGGAAMPPCPKCGHARRLADDACARCGLTFALWTPDKAAAVVQLDPAAQARWDELIAHWSDEPRHDAFLKYCSMAGLLAPAGRAYRNHLTDHPGDPVALRMQERIVAMATVSFSRPTAPRAPITRNVWFWAVMFLCGLAGVAGAVFLAAR